MDLLTLKKECTAVFRNVTRRDNAEGFNPSYSETTGIQLPEFWANEIGVHPTAFHWRPVSDGAGVAYSVF